MHNLLTRDRLLSLIVAPSIWATHFLFCYVWVSLACAFGLGGTSIVLALATLIALALLGYTGWANYRKWSQARHADTSDADLQAFFALNTMMLCGISVVALVWVAFPAAVLPTCAA